VEIKLSKSRHKLRFFLNLLSLIVSISFAPTYADESSNIENLFAQSLQYLSTDPEKAVPVLDKLEKLKPSFNKKQEILFYFYLSNSLGFRGRHQERIDLLQSIVDGVDDLEFKAKFLYYLSASLANVGDYEKAFYKMNEGIILLPKLSTLGSKITIIQGAINLLNSLNAYDEAMDYSNRMIHLEDGSVNSLSKCYGYANQVEINFFRKNSKFVQNNLKDSVYACEAVNRNIIGLIVKSLGAIDAINSGNLNHGIMLGLPLLKDLTSSVEGSEYVIRLEEALARAYLAKKDFNTAEQYGIQAYQKAKEANIVHLLESASETMAAIKQAQNQLLAASEYYQINSELKKKLLDDQLHRNLAYQRVKFDTQDKANQLALLEQKNKILLVEKQLELRKNENLVLLITLGTVLLAVISGWLITTWRQKNMFRKTSQTDGLTDISNRTHFIDSAHKVFANSRQNVSLVLFDMDHFKKINDTFGHAASDWVLKSICDVVKSQLRKTDLVGRLGGEEFGICLPASTEEEVVALAERCRAAISEIDTMESGYKFSISASFGVATRGKAGNQTFDETLAAADKALYLSKDTGRNRVSVY
jgi:diguanylate cyclase (GGDEF)-like protein